MARYHTTSKGNIPFTAEEELEADAIEADYQTSLPLVIENKRKEDITSKATQIIEAKYSPLKQRKLMSKVIAIQDKQLRGLTLSDEENTYLQYNRDINKWISDIRTIENTAIENGTALVEIDWEV